MIYSCIRLYHIRKESIAEIKSKKKQGFLNEIAKQITTFSQTSCKNEIPDRHTNI